MQLCLPVFKSELIWHPGGPRRAVALPREMRRKQRGRHSGGTESLAATGQRHRHTNVCTARYRNPTAKAREQLRGGGARGEGAASHWPGPTPKPRPLVLPGCACPVAWETGRARSGCGWKALATPALGTLSPRGGQSQGPGALTLQQACWEGLEGWRPQNLNCCWGLNCSRAIYSCGDSGLRRKNSVSGRIRATQPQVM